jgi:hypothetical protein
MVMFCFGLNLIRDGLGANLAALCIQRECAQ